MLKKRFIGMVVVKNGWAVQSFGYKKYLPLGKPECIVENLDRWGADEIVVISIDRTINNLGPDFELLQRLAKLSIDTPIVYGGGIRSVEEGVKVVQVCADRICFDALLHNNLNVVNELAASLGVQALIGITPLSLNDEEIELLDYQAGATKIIKSDELIKISNSVSELLVIDWKNEGQPDSFDFNLIDRLPSFNVPLIVFGGISNVKQMKALFLNENICAVAVGNFLSYKEHAIQNFKENLTNIPLRIAKYENSIIEVS
jgi:imidazole glycerol-phosphate synthase subunit HisF